MTGPRILLCTVGGSDAPVVTAVRAAAWDHVMFVCTDDSVAMVTDQVTVPERNAALATTRPSIPGQAGLDAAAWSTLTVPADDPNGVYAGLIEQFDRLHAQYPGAQVTVDFTGGTKSMSAGAVLAVASRPGTKLQVITGRRNDLIRVVDGTQDAVPLATDRILIERQIALLRDIWGRYGYQEAAEGFERLVREARDRPGVSSDLYGRLKFWAGLGRAFAAWDRFDRTQAAQHIRHPARRAGPELRRLAALADALLGRDKAGTPAPLVLFDLLRNAERCAARGRHDDAVARCYRLWEWTVQWLLETDSGIRTDGIEPGRVPADIAGEILGGLEETHGRYKIGSSRAWKLYHRLHPASEAAAFWNATDGGGKTNTKRYEQFSLIRNMSILAHGAQPIDAGNSANILAWTTGPFIDMVRAAARRLGEPDDMPQLPTDLPEPADRT